MNISRQLRAKLERRHWVRFWGQRRMCSPVFIEQVLGDGGKLLAVQPLNTRPNYYLIRIDSKWNESNYKEPCVGDHMDEIYEAIENAVGRGGSLTADESPTGRARFEDWPAANLDCGSSWWDATDLVPVRLRKSA